jgi:hypothetical protein
MHIKSRKRRPRHVGFMSLVLCLAGAPALGGAPIVVVPSTSAGGGPLSGGDFSAFTTIAPGVPTGPLVGGDFTLTAGLTRPRDRPPVGEQVFADGFEGGG